jgi:membrane associated rhomboid family serine protease
MVRALILMNSAVYVLQILTMRSGMIESYFALWPDRVISQFSLWQLFTYMFLHGPSVFHILFNMFALWMFGSDVERAMGSVRFLWYYLSTGIGAALFHMAFNWDSLTPVLGASGAIYGVLVAFAVLFPEREITLLLFFVLPIHLKAKYLAGVFMLIALIAGFQSHIGGSDGVAHLAHLGGGLVGFLLLRGTYLVRSWTFELAKRWQWQQMARKRRHQANKNEKRIEIDALLDKINQVGYGNLTAKEKASLKKAAEQLSDE